MEFSKDEFQFGRLANMFFFAGCLEAGPVTQRDRIQIEVMAQLCLEDLERFGLRTSARNLQDVIEILKGTHPSTNLHDYLLVFRSGLMNELESNFFLPVEYSVARYYREPRRDWEEVILRFPETGEDIEEASKCYALGRYAACLYHCMQVLEFGLLALGRFMEVADPKSGFTAVSNELERLLKKKYPDLTEFEKTNRAFFEQVNLPIQAVKDACRNKISHAEGRAILLRADFSPYITMEIYTIIRGLMRRLASVDYV